MINWQTISVAVIVLLACVYVAHRAWHRLRPFIVSKSPVQSSCASACGGCGKDNTNSSSESHLHRFITIRRFN